MFGSSTKVSLHESGDCQWSANADWWKDNKPETPNAERHMVKWSMPRPASNSAQHVFRIHIPRSELRLIKADENLKKVKWLPIPPEDHAVSLECYITPPTNSAPEESSTFPHEHLISMKMKCGRWFVILGHFDNPNRDDIEVLRSRIISQLENEWTSKLSPKHRITAFSVNDNGARGMIEMCPVKEEEIA